MSDPDAAPDPIDKAYVQAEAVLDDDAARAARRARVLAAVAREPAMAPAAALASPVRRTAWRRGGWLAAAGVAGLGALLAVQLYRPQPPQPQTAPTGRAASKPPTPAVPAPQTPAAQGTAAPSPAPLKPSLAPPAAPRAVAPSATATPVESAPTEASPADSAAPPSAFPAEPAPPPLPPPPAASAAVEGSAGVPAEDRAEGLAAQGAERQFGRAPAPALEVPRASASIARSPVASSPGGAARLRAAATAGRTTEIQVLLDQGVPVDAADADGDTALMKSIQADRPAAAALLRRHGASLDRRNLAGDSPRDLATQKDDAALNQALGLGP